MTSRERILASIRHQEPDRVPIDLGATTSSNMSVIAYNNLKKHLGMEGKTRVYDVVQQLAIPEKEILDRFNIDAVSLAQADIKDDEWYEIEVSDGSRAFYPTWFRPVLNSKGDWVASNKDGEVLAVMPNGATFYDQVCFPYQDGFPTDYSNLSADRQRVVWTAFGHSPWDKAGEENFWENLRAKALSLRQSTDRAILISAGCNTFEWGTYIRRLENFLMDLYIDLDEVKRFLDALMDQHMEFLAKLIDTVGDVVDIIRFVDDLGMDSAPLFSPDIYREVFKPRHKMLNDYVKSHSNLHTFLHSCGSIYPVIPDLIEAGFDIINPVQTNCNNMEPDRLKKEFGKDITFWGGGVDTQSILNRGSVQDVKDDVKRRLEIFTPGGGYIFNTVHNIMPDVPPENVVAMFEAIEEFYT